jgi:hypothetical protein
MKILLKEMDVQFSHDINDVITSANNRGEILKALRNLNNKSPGVDKIIY